MRPPHTLRLLSTTLGLPLLILAAVSGIVTACAPLRIINGLVPSGTFHLHAGLSFGAHPRQRLDVFVPASPPPATGAPVIVFYYGGRWESGHREDYLFVGEALASRGFVTVIPDYRGWPEVLFPQFLRDAALATAWAKNHAADFGGDARHVFLMGHSAGAHIAMLLSTNPEYLAEVGESPKHLAGVVGIAGPYDFLPLKSERVKAIFAAARDPRETQPIHFVTGAEPPLLLLTGAEDDIVEPGNSTRLATKVQTLGGSAVSITYAGHGHRSLLGALAAPLRRGEPVLDDIAKFIRETPRAPFSFTRG